MMYKTTITIVYRDNRNPKTIVGYGKTLLESMDIDQGLDLENEIMYKRYCSFYSEEVLNVNTIQK